MKHLFYILVLLFLVNCTTPEPEPVYSMVPKSGGSFSIGGDSIYEDDNYDTIHVTGLNTPYNFGQLANMKLTLHHPNLSLLSIYLYSPSPDNASYYFIDFGNDNSMTGANIINHIRIPNDSLPLFSQGTAPYTGVFSDRGQYSVDPSTGTFDATFKGVIVNGDWVLGIYNEGPNGYLDEFKLTFNY
jgi:hypothetical protein